jgi:Txe/YoeB family toxin of Txe-Axe toxin-antitoxin module
MGNGVCSIRVCELTDCHSRRINLRHRIGYKFFPDEGKVQIFRMWTRYGEYP